MKVLEKLIKTFDYKFRFPFEDQQDRNDQNLSFEMEVNNILEKSLNESKTY